MKIKPLNDRIIIKPQEPEKKTASGIYLPDSAQEKPMQGVVVEVGPGRRNEDGARTAPEVRKGDVVVYSKYSGTEIKIKGEDHLILGEAELLAVLDK